MKNFTIGKKVLVHLSCLSRHTEDFVCPQEMTQDGISLQLGISRAHAALELKRLKQKGYVDSRLAHVIKAKTRRKVYFLTESGEFVTKELKEKAKRTKIRMLNGNGGMECDGQKVIEILSSNGHSESEAIIKVLTSDVIPIIEAKGREKLRSSISSTVIVGRDQELTRLGKWFSSIGKAICVVSGPDGMGKSYMANVFATSIQELTIRKIIKPNQSVPSLLSYISNSLLAKGKPRLKLLLNTESYSLQEAVITLAEEIAGGLLLLDGVDNSAEIEDFVSKFLKMNKWPLKVLLISRRKPAFCQRWSDTFQKPYEDIVLGPLNEDSIKSLYVVDGFKPTEENLQAVSTYTQGRPFDLAFLNKMNWSFDGHEVPKILKIVKTSMSNEELGLIKIASVLQTPINPNRMKLSPPQTTLLKCSVMFHEDEHGFVLHEILKNLILNDLTKDEKRSLNEEAANIEESNNNFIEAAFHYLEAGLRETAIDVILKGKSSFNLLEISTELLSLIRAIGDDLRLEEVRGLVMKALGRFEDAKLCFERSLSILRGSAEIDVLLHLAEVENRLFLKQNAENHVKKAIDLSRDSEEKIRLARALVNLGFIYKDKKEIEKSRRCYHEAYEIYNNQSEWKEACKVKAFHGSFEFENGNYKNAIREYVTAIQSSEGRYTNSADFYYNLGLAYHELEDEVSAIAYFKKAIEIAEMFGRVRLVMKSLIRTAESCLIINQINDASETCQKALKLGDYLSDPALTAQVHTTLGFLNKKLGLWKRAESHFITSIDLVKSLNDSKNLAKRYTDLALLYETTGDTRKARVWRTRADRMGEWENFNHPSPRESKLLNFT